MVDPYRPRWQFSLRGMLLFTAAVCGLLAVAVKVPGILQVALVATSVLCVIFAIVMTLLAANVLTSEKRPRLATISWLVIGIFFSCYTLGITLYAHSEWIVRSEKHEALEVFGVVTAICSVVSFYRAGATYSRSRRPRTDMEREIDDLFGR